MHYFPLPPTAVYEVTCVREKKNKRAQFQVQVFVYTEKLLIQAERKLKPAVGS